MRGSAADVARGLGGHRSGNGWLCRCPVPSHGQGRRDRRPSLLVSDDGHGGIHPHCFAGCTPQEVVAALGFGEADRRAFPRPGSAPVAGAGAADNHALALQLWARRQSPAGTIVEAYWRCRGIDILLPPSIGFIPDLWHRPTRQRLPAMIAAVQNVAGRIVAVHRTYLRRDGCGKADVTPAKMALGPCAGGAVRLGPVAEELAIGEGIESSASAAELMGLPAWAALSTSGMRRLVLPDVVKTLWIAADPDGPGIAAAHALARRAKEEGRRVMIARPSDLDDFNSLAQGINRVAYSK